ncbi:MAG: hypothetical protein PHX18_07200 [Candidatus Gastranaerophilales bacterium]|nr:hypothetical protein [Candidatus Gastranaerophilales bacterium]
MDNLEKLNLEQTVSEKANNPLEEYAAQLERENALKNGKKSNQAEVPKTQEAMIDYLLPQFKSVEDQAKSYKELQSLYTRQAQELAKLKKGEEFALQKSPINVPEQPKVDFYAQEQKLKAAYLQELEALEYARRSGKIGQSEKLKMEHDLQNFFNKEFALMNLQMQQQKQSKPLDLVAPSEFFSEELKTKKYLEPVSAFLDKNYSKLSKNELEGIRDMVNSLEVSLREEIQNELSLKNENESYRQKLTSATSLNHPSMAEKIYSIEEIKNMNPEEFRKNRAAILEQFTSRKIR